MPFTISDCDQEKKQAYSYSPESALYTGRLVQIPGLNKINTKKVRTQKS